MNNWVQYFWVEKSTLSGAMKLLQLARKYDIITDFVSRDVTGNIAHDTPKMTAQKSIYFLNTLIAFEPEK